MEGKHSAGKGDNYRKVDYLKWSKNYDSIFKKKLDKQTKIGYNKKPKKGNKNG